MAERYEPEAEPDRRLRASLEAPSGAAGRIVRNALATAPPEPPRRWPRLVASAAALAATAALVFLSLRGFDGRRRADAAREGPVAEARFAVTNRDGIVLVRSLDGGLSSLYGPVGRDPSPPGMRIIVLGENRP